MLRPEELAFLLEASQSLTASLDEAEVRARAVSLAVPFLGKSCRLVAPGDLAAHVPGETEVEIRLGEGETLGALLLAPRDSTPASAELLDAYGRALTQALRNAVIVGRLRRELESQPDLEEAQRVAREREKKRGDENFALFLRDSPLALAVISDPECRNVLLNPVLAGLLEVPATPDAPLTAVDLSDLAPRFEAGGVPLDADAIPVVQAVREKRKVLDAELDVRRADGTLRNLFGHAVPFFSEEGHFRGCLGAFFDVTVRREAERALAEADRNKDAFLALLGHELRSPLAAMVSAVHLLRLRIGDDGAVTRTCELLDRQLKQTARLVDDLQDVSRVKHGRLTLRQTRVDIVSLVRHVADARQPAAAQRQLELAVTVPAGALELHADPVRIEQVVTNLLGNAIKYTDPGGAVYLSLERDDGHAMISVRDTGAGISADLLPGVFDLYQQIDSTLDRSQGGLGIGLALARGLVEMHGGTISAHSEGPGTGSEFRVRLPLSAG